MVCISDGVQFEIFETIEHRFVRVGGTLKNTGTLPLRIATGNPFAGSDGPIRFFVNSDTLATVAAMVR